MTTPDAFRDAEYVANVSNIRYDDDEEDEGISSAPSAGSPASSRARETQARVKTVYLNRLLRDFDILIYCQLSLLYYMDCSIFHFAIRAIVQLLFFTPKTGAFPETPKNQPYLAAVLISSTICILLHLMSANPSAGEASRGYLHGGLFIDFVGQKGPISKFQLLLIDVLVAMVQIVMLGVVVEKERTKRALPPDNLDETASSTDASPGQDHDAEERGMLRTDDGPTPVGDDIEMQELRRSDTRDTANNERTDDELNGLLSESTHEPEKYKHPRDIFTSGEAVIMEMSVIQVIRDQWRHTPKPSFRVPVAPATSQGPASVFFRRRFGINTSPDT